MINNWVMKTLLHKLLLALALLGGFVTVGAHAAQDGVFALERVRSADGFATNEPTINHYQLQRVVDDTSSYLVDKQATLEKDISKHRKAGNNLVLAAVMPGGLLYLAYHKGQQLSAEKKLDLVEQSRQELQEDSKRLELETSPVIIARFP